MHYNYHPKILVPNCLVMPPWYDALDAIMPYGTSDYRVDGLDYPPLRVYVYADDRPNRRVSYKYYLYEYASREQFNRNAGWTSHQGNDIPGLIAAIEELIAARRNMGRPV